MIAEYILSIDGDNEDELGIFEIANTESPAIKMKGIAFSTHKELVFKDDLKYRIAAPVLTPSKIYRVDEETGEESYYVVTVEFIEQGFARFMQNRVGKDVFNDEHDESKRVPSFIYETWLVDKPKEDKSFTTYGIECPKGTWFAVQQYTDKEMYKEHVAQGKTGFSIHGNANLLMSEIKKQKKDMLKFKAKKRKIVAHYAEAEKAESGEVIIAVDELAVGADVVVLDENMEEVDNFSGSLETNEGAIVVTDGAIESIGEVVEAEEEVEATEEVKEEEKPVEAEEVEKKEEEVEASEEEKKEEVQMEGEFYTKEEIDAKHKELIDYIAEEFNKLKETAKDEAEDVAEEVVDEVQMKMSMVDAWREPQKRFKK